MSNYQSKKKYCDFFSEKKSLGTIAHPYNAYSSLIYIYIFNRYIFQKSKKLIAVLNLLLGIASYFFHATENHIIEQIDLTIIYALKLTFLLLQLDITSTNINKIICSYLCLMFANLYKNKYTLDRYIGNYFRNHFLTILTSAILWSKKRPYKSYFIFCLAYICKFTDMYLASHNIHDISLFQGTAFYHLLTGYAMKSRLDAF